MRFQAPQLGALGVTFTGLRLMQCASLIAIIGMLAKFIDEIVTSQRAVPDVMVGTLSVASVAVLYSMISYILYYDGLLPLLIAVGTDFAMLIAFIVAAATTGKPLTPLNCKVLPRWVGEKSASATKFTYSVPKVNFLAARDDGSSSIYGADDARPKANFLAFVAQDQPHCMQIKAVWGLCIALCVLFAFSAIVCGGLWRRVKGSQAPPPKDIEG
jgi:hypothetical protein